MNVTSTSSFADTYLSSLKSGGNSRAIQSQITLLEQQISSIEQSSLEDSAKEDQIAALEARIENLQRQMELQQSRQTTASSEVASVLSPSVEEDEGSTISNVTYASSGSSSSASYGSGRLIAYA